MNEAWLKYKEFMAQELDLTEYELNSLESAYELGFKQGVINYDFESERGFSLFLARVLGLLKRDLKRADTKILTSMRENMISVGFTNPKFIELNIACYYEAKHAGYRIAKGR